MLGYRRRNRARRLDTAFCRKPHSRGRCHPGCARLQCQRGRADRRDLSCREGTWRSAPEAPVAQRNNAVFTGTSVRSGTASVLVGSDRRPTPNSHRIAAAVERHIPETGFARGIRRFGYLMTEIMLAIVIMVFFANLMLHRPLIDSLLFSLALAVGLTPELLPAIISVTLARGAPRMASSGVIVRRLDAIENFGSMDLLCTDKTGTLTEGVSPARRRLDVDGNPSADDPALGASQRHPADRAQEPAGRSDRRAAGEGASLATSRRSTRSPTISSQAAVRRRADQGRPTTC